jgi:hypothetical protein
MDTGTERTFLRVMPLARCASRALRSDPFYLLLQLVSTSSSQLAVGLAAHSILALARRNHTQFLAAPMQTSDMPCYRITSVMFFSSPDDAVAMGDAVVAGSRLAPRVGEHIVPGHLTPRGPPSRFISRGPVLQ